jgi:peptidoglycan hydrolase-like protein with peptidoglycan-binding domain
MKALVRLVTCSLMLTVVMTPLAAQTRDPNDVELAQKALKSAGHDPGPIDGIMGAKTSAALRAFQKAHKLGETGRLDEATFAKLREPETSMSASPRAGATPPAGGDTRPNAVDPAQSTKTGANASEGASYSRSNEKGQSTMGADGQKK